MSSDLCKRIRVCEPVQPIFKDPIQNNDSFTIGSKRRQCRKDVTHFSLNITLMLSNDVYCTNNLQENMLMMTITQMFLLCQRCAPPESHYITSAVKLASFLKDRQQHVPIYLPVRRTVRNTPNVKTSKTHIRATVRNAVLIPKPRCKQSYQPTTFLCNAIITQQNEH